MPETILNTLSSPTFTTVCVAALGILGSGTAWKFYSAHSKRKHAEKMKELEIKHERVENAGEQIALAVDGHEKCAAERATLEARVAGLEARLEEVSAASAASRAPVAPVDPFDFNELKQRLEKLEQAKKARKAAKPKPE